MKLEIKSIGIWSLIKISVFINLIVGFIFGIFYAFMISFMSSAGMLPLDIMGDGDVTLMALLIVTPIMFSIGGAVFGTIWAVVCVFIYNLLARLIGGLEINTIDVSVKENSIKQQQVTVPPPPHKTTLPNVEDSTPDTEEKKNDQNPGNNYEI